MEAPVRRASVGWKAVQLVRVLAFEACLEAEPSVSSLPPHKIKFDLRSLPNQARGQYMDASVPHGDIYTYVYVYVCVHGRRVWGPIYTSILCPKYLFMIPIARCK